MNFHEVYLKTLNMQKLSYEDKGTLFWMDLGMNFSKMLLAFDQYPESMRSENPMSMPVRAKLLFSMP